MEHPFTVKDQLFFGVSKHITKGRIDVSDHAAIAGIVSDWRHHENALEARLTGPKRDGTLLDGISQ
jgi:hypothetical protein